MTIQQLLEQRQAKVAEATLLVDSAKKENRSLDDGQQQKFDALDKEITGLDNQITRAKKIAEWERQAIATPINDNVKDSVEVEARKCSLINFINLGIPDYSGSADLAREREVHTELAKRSGSKPKGIMIPTSIFEVEKRVISSTAPSSQVGGNLIATQLYDGQYIDLLRAKLITAQRGALVLSGLVGNVDIPAGKSSATAGWVAENAAISASNLGFRKVSMAPKHVGALTEFSRNMLLQSSPGIEQLIRNDFAAVLAEAVDRAAINGGGSNEPDGIMQNSIGTSSMTDPTWEGVLAMIEQIEAANADMGALGWATTPSLVRKLRSTLKVEDDAAAGFIMDKPTELAGYALSASTLVPSVNGGSPAVHTASLIYGDWSQLILGYWSAFEILVNPYESTAYSKGNIQVRGMLTMDAALRHNESFVAASAVDTSLSD